MHGLPRPAFTPLSWHFFGFVLYQIQLVAVILGFKFDVQCIVRTEALRGQSDTSLPPIKWKLLPETAANHTIIVYHFMVKRIMLVKQALHEKLRLFTCVNEMGAISFKVYFLPNFTGCQSFQVKFVNYLTSFKVVRENLRNLVRQNKHRLVLCDVVLFHDKQDKYCMVPLCSYRIDKFNYA